MCACNVGPLGLSTHVIFELFPLQRSNDSHRMYG